MAVVLPSDEAAHFAPGLRRSHSQPKFSSTPGTFRQSASTSRISDAYSQQSSHNPWPRRTLGSHEPSPSESPPPPQEQEPGSPSQAYQKIPVFSDSSATSSSSSSPRLSPTVDTPHAPSPTKLLVPSMRLPQRLGRPGYGSSPIGTDDGNEDATIDIDYSHYEGVSYYDPAKDYEAQHSLHGVGEAYAPSTNTVSSTALSRSDSSEFDVFQLAAEDDTAIRALPSRHVDYLSHNWREEDIWESWKYIVSRRGDYSNSARLENASWRTWMKSKNKLKTISPETLNWLKDCDVTWLYGPLQTGHESFVRTGHATDSVELTKSNSFLAGHKPILKKRSMSEMMLQRSISASSLLKQAAAAVQAQQKDMGVRRTARPRLDRAITDYVTFPFSSSHPFSIAPSTRLHSASGHSSGLISPSEKKHIHFNEQVEQCIAVDAKGDDGEEEEVAAPYDDSDSDDDAIMMKRAVSRHRMQPRQRHTFPGCTESKPTIAMLPSTTLKYRDDPSEDADDSSGSAMKHSYRSPVLSPSSSQETLRPSRSSGRLFIGADEDDEDEDDEDEDEDDGFQFGRARCAGPMIRGRGDNGAGADDDNDDEEDDDETMGMSMGSSRRRATGRLTSSASTSRLGSLPTTMAGNHTQSIFAGSSAGSGGGGLKRTTSTSSLSGTDAAGMRRTASGMFMPIDEGEPAVDGANGGANGGGLVGRFVDAVNTARDIVHVIWNVGWRN